MYATREVRDLAWACFSPPLLLTPSLGRDSEGLANCGLELTDERRAWLEELDRNPAQLLSFLAARPQSRLGLYFECLWQFLLQQDPQLQLLAHNLPVRDGGRTIGEFDCLYYCRRRKCDVHLELAVKYYLGYPPATPGQRWLGPNSSDRLDLKVARLLQHQARLSEHPVAAQLLTRLGISPELREVEIKGYLFGPPHTALPAPPGLHPQRALHPWVSVQSLAGFLRESGADSYRVLQRLQWLAPAWREDPGIVLDREGLLEALRDCRRPQLVAAFGADGWETQRFFVTDAAWPGLQAGASQA